MFKQIFYWVNNLSAFFDRFNTYSNNKYSFLRLSGINVYLKTKIAEFCFVCPEDKYEEALKNLDDIKTLIEKSFSTELKIAAKIKKSHFDPQFFVQDIIRFFSFYASLKGCISKRSIDFDYDIDSNTHKVFITLKKSAYLVFNSRNLMRELEDFIYSNYCEKICVQVIESNEEETLSDYELSYFLDDDRGRFINISNIKHLVGKEIDERPSYICDARPTDYIVLCGKIQNWREIERKQSSNGKDRPNFFKFDLKDGTGIINCISFPSEKDIEKIRALNNDIEIVARGKVELNTFVQPSTLTFYVRHISYCELPKEFSINRLKLDIPKRYKNVFPKPYSDYVQIDLFSSLNQYTPKFLKGREFVVFDIETTGLDKFNDKIIEIGAVKIIDGIFTETFSTVVDPERPIPKNITDLTGISDQDVKEAFLLNEVLPDLYKFFGNSVLVGHNLESFDFPFLALEASKLNIYFDNKRLDTYNLAKEYLPLKRYKLQDLAEHFNIENPNAHRALDDAITTAKIFVAMADKFNFEI